MSSTAILANMLLIHNVCQYRMIRIQTGSYKTGLRTEAECSEVLDKELAIVERSLTRMRDLSIRLEGQNG